MLGKALRVAPGARPAAVTEAAEPSADGDAGRKRKAEGNVAPSPQHSTDAADGKRRLSPAEVRAKAAAGITVLHGEDAQRCRAAAQREAGAGSAICVQQ